MATKVLATADEVESFIAQLPSEARVQMSLSGSAPNFVVSYPDGYAAQAAAANPSLPPPPQIITPSNDQLQTALALALSQLAALTARVVAEEGAADFKLPVYVEDDLPSLTEGDRGRIVYVEDGNGSKPGLAMWAGDEWRKVKDGNRQ